MRAGLIAVVLLSHVSVAVAQNALAQLRAQDGGNAAPQSAPPSAESSCTIGSYKGSCFYTPDGQLVYWVVKRWDGEAFRFGLEPGTITGYPFFLEKQQAYNRWLQSVKADRDDKAAFEDSSKGEYPYLLVDDRKLGSKFDRDSNARYGWEMLMGWHGYFRIPDTLSESGQMTEETVKIPFFMAGARILELAGRLRKDHYNLDLTKCGNPDDADYSWTCQHDGVAGLRLDHLAKAFQSSMKFDRALRDFIQKPYPYILIRDPGDVTPEIMKTLEALQSETEEELALADEAERLDPERKP